MVEIIKVIKAEEEKTGRVIFSAPDELRLGKFEALFKEDEDVAESASAILSLDSDFSSTGLFPPGNGSLRVENDEFYAYYKNNEWSVRASTQEEFERSVVKLFAVVGAEPPSEFPQIEEVVTENNEEDNSLQGLLKAEGYAAPCAVHSKPAPAPPPATDELEQIEDEMDGLGEQLIRVLRENEKVTKQFPQIEKLCEAEEKEEEQKELKAVADTSLVAFCPFSKRVRFDSGADLRGEVMKRLTKASVEDGQVTLRAECDADLSLTYQGDKLWLDQKVTIEVDGSCVQLHPVRLSELQSAVRDFYEKLSVVMLGQEMAKARAQDVEDVVQHNLGKIQ